MRGCAGAGSTQARTLTCTSPPPLALHPCLDRYGFRVLSNSDRAPVFLFVLCTCLACWKLDLLGPEVPVWIWGWLEALVFFSRCPDWTLPNLEQLDLGLQAGLVQTRRAPVWVWGWFDVPRLDRCQFGFGGGSRPLVFRVPWMQSLGWVRLEAA